MKILEWSLIRYDHIWNFDEGLLKFYCFMLIACLHEESDSQSIMHDT